MAENHYRRLTWGRRRYSGLIVFTQARSSLWLGQDHVLSIDSNGYSESYKRFYFQDIRAVTIRLTRRRLIWNAVLGVPTAICLAGWGYHLAFSNSTPWPGIIIGGALILMFGVPFLINNLRGPTCICHLHTAVQIEELPSLSRLQKTRRILNLLRPLIAQAQGQLAPEEIPARVQAWTAAAAAASVEADARYVVDDPNLPPRIIS